MLFLGAEMPHVAWMDVFAAHITVHFIPAPVVTMLVVFLLSLTAYSLAMSWRTVAAATALAAGAVTFTAAWGLAAPIRVDIEDQRVDRGIALCPVQLTHL